MFCTHCGKDIGEGVKFCPFCGTKQDESNNEGIGDKIGRQIDDAVNDFEGEFKQFEDSAGKAFENASDGFRQTQEKADDIRNIYTVTT